MGPDAHRRRALPPADRGDRHPAGAPRPRVRPVAARRVPHAQRHPGQRRRRHARAVLAVRRRRSHPVGGRTVATGRCGPDSVAVRVVRALRCRAAGGRTLPDGGIVRPAVHPLPLRARPRRHLARRHRGPRAAGQPVHGPMGTPVRAGLVGESPGDDGRTGLDVRPDDVVRDDPAVPAAGGVAPSVRDRVGHPVLHPVGRGPAAGVAGGHRSPRSPQPRGSPGGSRHGPPRRPVAARCRCRRCC